MVRFGGDAASVILVLTDGVISDQANASVQVYIYIQTRHNYDGTTNLSKIFSSSRLSFLAAEVEMCLLLEWEKVKDIR